MPDYLLHQSVLCSAFRLSDVMSQRIKLMVIIILVFCLSSLSHADSTNKEIIPEELTPEQQEEIAKNVGVILPGMTKKDIIDTYSDLLIPKRWYTHKGQEAWYYKSPRKQNIYFNGDIVERVEYNPRMRQRPLIDVKKPEEI